MKISLNIVSDMDTLYHGLPPAWDRPLLLTWFNFNPSMDK